MGAVAAAVIMRKERELVDHFRQAGAVSVSTAQSLTQLGVHADGVGWHRLTQRAVVREASPGFYYFDEPSWNALRYVRHRMLFVVFAVAIIVAIGAWLSARAR